VPDFFVISQFWIFPGGMGGRGFFSDGWMRLAHKFPAMKPRVIFIRFLLAAVVAVSLAGCVTRRTVTRGGETVESKYVFSSPFD
jgi:hypothetical protein